MPWARNDALPDSWRNAGYSDRCLTAGRRAANNALDPNTGGGAASDASAARIFHAVAKRCDGKELDAVETKMAPTDCPIDDAALDAWADATAKHALEVIAGEPVIGAKAEPGDGTREIKDFPTADFELKEETATGYKTLAGYVSIFGNVDAQDDVVDPGAFRQTIADRVEAGKVKLLTDHVWSVPTTMGTFRRAAEDSKGLEFEADLIQRVAWVQDAAEAAAQGHVSGLSMGYEAMRRYFENAKAIGKRIRHLAEVKLFEGSLTPFPANELAAVTGVKAEGRAVMLAKAQLDSLVDTLRMGGRHTDPEDRAIVADAIKRLQTFLVSPDGKTAPDDEAADDSIDAHRMAWQARAAEAAHNLQRYSDHGSSDHRG